MSADPVEIRAEDTSKPFDVFLSHNSGKDIEGRDNHARVKRLCQELESKGIKTWCDEYDMEGNICEAMAKGIDNSKKVIVFVTEEYIKKANGEAEKGTKDNVYREFNYISNHVKLHNIITVVMEESARDIDKWRGTFGFSLEGQLYIDFSKESGLSRCLKDIKKSFYRPPPEQKIHEITYPDASVYEGKFNEDKKNDRHASIAYKKSGFVGIKANKIEDRGRMEYKDGALYEGSWKNGKKHSKGEIDHQNEDLKPFDEENEDIKPCDEDAKDLDPAEKPAKDSKPFDVFLSHNWGMDTRGRDNHARVKRLCEELESKGIKTWCDEYDMKGNICEAMAKGIDNSKKVIVFVTEEYIKKANGEAEKGTKDNVYREFNYISNHVKLHNIITVVMEESARDIDKWRGTFGINLSGQLYIDFSKEGLSRCSTDIKKSFYRPPPEQEIHEITYPDGSVYEGPVNGKMQRHGYNMQRHGYGKLTDRHGNVYEGKFNEDKKDDRHASILYKKSGVEFEGRFKNDKICPSTRGTLTLKDGTVMKGSFVGSKKIGIFDGPDVTLTYAKSGNKYIGDIKANKIEGRGRMEYKDGAVYEGSWQNGKKHGSGRMNYQNGDVYSGQWKNNMRHGKGKLDLANHDRYIGYFRNDMMQGKKGTYLVANGSKYEGGFVKNQRCGNGTFTSEDDRVSCGQWKDDKLHGKGYREYSNGDKYYGYFKESQRNGEGEMLFASSALYAGQWREDRMRQGVFDFEQVERNRKKKGWSSLKANSQAILCTIQFKDNEVNEWAALSPKRVRRKNLFSCKSSEAISFVSEDFVNKSEDFITNLGMTGLSEKYSKNLSSDHSRTISSSPLGTPKRGASLILPFSPADTVLSEESFVNHTDFDPYLVKKVDVGGICK